MIDHFGTITVLKNFLPLLGTLKKNTIVIKFGGAAMTDITLIHDIIEDIILLYNLGLKLIIVHGGGPMINFWLNKINI